MYLVLKKKLTWSMGLLTVAFRLYSVFILLIQVSLKTGGSSARFLPGIFFHISKAYFDDEIV